MNAPQGPSGVLALLRTNAAYRRIYLARLVSMAGDWFNLLALVALLREVGGNSAMALGGTLILKSLPPLLATPLAGLVVDRFNRQQVMILSDIGRAIVVLGMLAQIWYPSLPVLYALVALQAFMGAFFEPARRAIVPSVVKAEDLETAGALDAATWSAMLTLGAAAGGLVTAWMGWEAALLADAASYLVSMAFLLRLPAIEAPERKGSGTLAEGVQYMASHRRVWTLVFVKSLWTIGGAATLILTLLGEGPLHARDDSLFSGLAARVQDSDMLGVTALYVARGIGTGLGPFLARWMSRGDKARMERLIGLGFLWGGVFYALVGLAGMLHHAMLLIAIAHLGGATCWVFSTVRLQQVVPGRLLGRVFSAELAGFTATFAASTAIYSWASDAGTGAQTLAVWMGAALFTSGLLWQLRQLWLKKQGEPLEWADT